jgi:hypothetical protein
MLVVLIPAHIGWPHLLYSPALPDVSIQDAIAGALHAYAGKYPELLVNP